MNSVDEVDKGFSVREGLATLGPELVETRMLLERRFLAFATECGADAMAFPPLVRVADLADLDYFDNFPHLALLTAPLEAAEAAEATRPAEEVVRDGLVRDGAVSNHRLGPSEHGLASAACYSIYLHLRGTMLNRPRYVTTVAPCVRNENGYEGLRRLRSFTMREIVCLGPKEAVQDHLSGFKPKIVEFARDLGLRLEIRPATDPFFQADGARAVLQRLFPVKEEFVHDDSLAIASVNFHRNFFGERCDIALPGGEPAYTGCVAFGLERWLAALLETHGSAAAARAVAASITPAETRRGTAHE